jgi:hypothetical protein
MNALATQNSSTTGRQIENPREKVSIIAKRHSPVFGKLTDRRFFEILQTIA